MVVSAGARPVEYLASADTLRPLTGWIIDARGGRIPSAMVVNRMRPGAGQFVDADGQFHILAAPGDTLAFGALGYFTRQIPVPKEDPGPDWVIELHRLHVQLGAADVVAPRELREILRDIQSLGYDEQDFRISRVNAVSSPITYLYEQFSRTERSRRTVAGWENDDRRRALLRELFVRYVAYDIIQLDEDQFDAFIRFCDPGDEQLTTWSQYEFIRYVKRRFMEFQSRPRPLEDTDYQYQLD
jgi:hypothetical protein